MQHYFALVDMKKSFKAAQDYHRHAIQNGSPETKAWHLSHHIKGGNYDVLVQRSSTSNNKSKRA